MPPVVAGVVVALTALGASAATAAILAPIILSIGVSLALGGITRLLVKPASGSLLNDVRGRLVTIRQAAASRRIIYGQTRVGGILSYARAFGLRIAPTDQNQLVVTIAGHAISDWNNASGIIAVQFDDEFPEIDAAGIGIGSWAGKVFVQIKHGYDGDEAFPSLLSDSQANWSANHRQRGCAAAYIRLNYDEVLYPRSVPNFTFNVKGKPVFDPRTDQPLEIVGATNATPIVIHSPGWFPGNNLDGGSVVRILGVAGNTAANGTWGIDAIDNDHFSLQGSSGNGAYTSGGQIFKLGYSNNAALVIADYLMDPWVGMGVPWAKIRESVLLAAANVCDEEIELDEASPPTTEFRYAINGTFETSEQHGEILAQMANAMAGHVTYIGGEWHIIPGAFRLPVMELTDRHVVAPMQVQTKRSKRDLVNGIKGTFPSALHNYIETDFPAIPGATYLAEDQGIRVWKDIFLPFTTSPTACQRIAEIELNRNRRQISVQMTCSMAAYELQPGDVVEFTHSRYSWALETFEVAEVGLGQNEDGAMVVTLQLVQTDVQVYGFAVDDYGNLIDPDLLDLLSRTIPFGWSPGRVHSPTATALAVPTFRDRSDYSFALAQQYQLNAAGVIVPQLRIAGFMPTNVFSQVISRPRTKTLTATTAVSGGFITGGQRYYIAVAALDRVVSGSPPTEDIGRVTALSEIAVVDVPVSSPADLSTVTLTDLRWHADTMGWLLYFGTDKFRLSSQSGASYLGSLGSAVTVVGPDTQPTSITFKGINVPLQLPDGYFKHLRGAPDQRFERLRIKAYRAVHLGVWGGQVVSVEGAGSPPTEPYTITLGVDPATPWTTNIFAGRYISLVGSEDSAVDFVTTGGQPIADFLIASNTGNTVTLATGQANPADHGFILGAVVVIRTKATAVGVEDSRNYIEDLAFGEGGQELGDQDPNIGGGEDSLRGLILRIIAGTGIGTKAVISGNTGDASPATDIDRIYIEGEWDVTPDTTSVFIVTDPFPSLQHDSDPLPAQQLESFVFLKIDAPSNLAGEQYLIIGVCVSAQGKESPEASSPYRELYLFGKADAGREVTTDTSLTLLDRYIRGNTTAGGFTITALDPAVMPGIEVLIENSGTGSNTLTVVVDGGSLLAGESSVELADGETALIRARDDL